MIVHRTAVGHLTAPSFAIGGPINFALTVRNPGNVHRDYITPHALHIATGDDTGVTLPDFTVLAGSTRVMQGSWDNPPAFCICHASVQTDDGQGHPITVRTTVVILPLRQIGGALVIALGLILIYREFRRRRTRASTSLKHTRREGYEQAKRDAAD